MPKLGEKAASAVWSPRICDDLKRWSNRKLGIDRAIAFNILARGWSSVAGLVTVALIARFLTPQQQGYYYTFGSLIALQIIFELGFSLVILQMASHERAHLTISADGQVTGDLVAHSRLASVLQRTVKWYSSGALLLAISLLVAGFHFFRAHRGLDDHVSWQAPWIFAVLAATLTFQLDPILSFMEGCGFVSNVARLRLIQAASGSICAWLVLFFHKGLFAPGTIIFANAVGAIFWLSRRKTLLLSLLRFNSGPHKIGWAREVWPFQWRIALSWLCGYLIFQLYTPVLFAYHGAAVAGQMGMSLSLANALLSVSISWINTKAAPFGALVARKEYTELDHIFFRALWQSLGVCIAGIVCVWAGVLY